jgi:hypothetical protein
MLSKLIYVSARTPNCTEKEIQKILASCEKNNAKLDITGVLLYTTEKFVQYLEGEYKTIFSLYDKIKQDDRHKNLVLIYSGPIKDKVFPSWHMAGKKVDLSTIEFDTAISEQDKKGFMKLLDGEDTPESVKILKRVFK